MKSEKLKYILDLSEVSFPDMTDGQRAIFTLCLDKAYKAGQAAELESLMSEQRKLRTELALMRFSKWK
jgi:hypothetical protein